MRSRTPKENDFGGLGQENQQAKMPDWYQEALLASLVLKEFLGGGVEEICVKLL